MARTTSQQRRSRRRGGAAAALSLAAVVVALAASSSSVASAEPQLEVISRGDGSQEPTRATLGSIPGVTGASAALHGETGSSAASAEVAASVAASSSTSNSTASQQQGKKKSFSSYPFPASLRLGHWDPPTSGCAAALLNNPNYTQVAQPDGSTRFFLPWETWPCMNGAQVRTFLTAKRVAAAGSKNASALSDDDCRTLDAGFEISTWAFNASALPTATQANACRPPFCAHFGGKVNGTLCQQPYLREYFPMPGAGTHFQPFEVAQLDWEPEGHAPMGVYSDPHLDLHLYYTDKAAVESIGVGGCNRWGFLSQDAWYRSLKPVPIQCFPTGAYTNTALAVSGMGTHLVNVLSPEFKPPFHGFGQTLILGSYDGAINFVELMASAHWLSANAALGKRLCFPIIGSPKEYRYGGLKPHKYCFEPDSATGTTTIRFTDLLWFEPGCVETKDTVFAPDSFAPPIQEAILLNPTCTYPKPGGLNASAAALDAWNKSALWSEARAELAAALAETVSPPLPVTVAVTKGYAIDRAVTSALAEGYTTLREPATLSNNNGKPFNATLQKAIGKDMILTAIGKR